MRDQKTENVNTREFNSFDCDYWFNIRGRKYSEAGKEMEFSNRDSILSKQLSMSGFDNETGYADVTDEGRGLANFGRHKKGRKSMV